MLTDFSKLMTFLTVVRERSFSKASNKLGISQPAVTQQIKFIEDSLNAHILDRKKNGVLLTKEGEELFKTALKLEKAVLSAEKELTRIFNKELTFIIQASVTIGNYILPQYINNLKEVVGNDILIDIKRSELAIQALLDRKCDMVLIETPVQKEGVIYREWLEDELVLFSNSPLSKVVKSESLKTFSWICREEGSHTKKIVSEALEELGTGCHLDEFDVKSVISDSTAIKQTILKAPVSDTKPTVAMISRHVIEDEVKNGSLFEARVKNTKITRKFYIAYLKDRRNDAYVNAVVNHLNQIKK